jgi:hypothetical protein
MARTAAGAALTQQHYRSQLALRAAALRDFTTLWPLWHGDEVSFRRLVEATVPLVRANRQLSATVATSYYEAFRIAEGAAGRATPRPALPLSEDRFEGALYVTGAEQTRDALLAGQTSASAMQTAKVRMTGAVGRNILRGGAETIVLSAADDREARGWARVTSGRPCAFCAMLAGRGAVYSADSVDFKSHDHCSCSAEVVYGDSALPGRGAEFKRMYNEATRGSADAGDLKRGTSNDLLNAFRRHLDD